MRKMIALALVVVAYTTSTFADEAALVAQVPVKLAHCGSPCAADRAAPAQAAPETAGCSGAGCVQDDAPPAKSGCDDEHPCFDP